MHNSSSTWLQRHLGKLILGVVGALVIGGGVPLVLGIQNVRRSASRMADL